MKFDQRMCMVIDLESTCWETKTPIERKDEVENSEVIEIGGAIVDRDKLAVVGAFDLYTIPVRSEISEYCTKLTGITPEKIAAEGIPFPDAMAKLRELVLAYRVGCWASWGDYDRRMLLKSCVWWDLVCWEESEYDVRWPLPRSHRNLKTEEAWARVRSKGAGLDRGVHAAGLDWGTRRNHNGADDAAMGAQLLIEISRPLEVLRRQY